MLRRTKKELFENISFKLPSKDHHVIEIELSSEERNAYEQLLQFSRLQLYNYLCTCYTNYKFFSFPF